MKKILLLVVFASTVGGAFAQFNQGRILAGGSVAFSTTTNKMKTGSSVNTTGQYTSFSFSPDVGYFVADNIAVGAQLSLGTGTSKSEGTPAIKSTTTNVSLVPFVRYYLDQGIFFEGEVGIGSNKTKYTSGSTSTEGKSGVFRWGIGAGYAYFLNDFVAVEPIVSYSSVTNTDKEDDDKSISSGIGLRIALQVYLGPRQ